VAVRKLRAGVAGGIAMLGAGVLLSACSPVQMGAAAIVGNGRISQSTLASDVNDLQTVQSGNPGGVARLTSAQMTPTVLTWMIGFKIMDRAASNAGVSVSSAQVQHGISDAQLSAESQVQQQQLSLSDPRALTLISVKGVNGIKAVNPQLLDSVGRYQAQLDALAAKFSGGKPMSALKQADFARINAELSRLTLQSAKSLNIKVNPQYGKMNLTPFAVVPAPDTLSKSASGSTSSS
jgi:hypothetical protein